LRVDTIREPTYVLRIARAVIAFTVGAVFFLISVMGVLTMFVHPPPYTVFGALVCPIGGIIVGAIEDRRDWWAAGALACLLIVQGVIDIAFPLVERADETQAGVNALWGGISVVAFLVGVVVAKVASRAIAKAWKE
jgi:hypothetical protein